MGVTDSNLPCHAPGRVCVNLQGVSETRFWVSACVSVCVSALTEKWAEQVGCLFF